MKPFVSDVPASRVVFGAGTLSDLRSEVARLGINRAFFLSTAAQRETIAVARASMADLFAGEFADAAMHTPVAVTDTALAMLRAADADGLVSIGGGSAIGLGKALALRTGLPHLAVPTTYAGSEMTPILGQTEEGVKTTMRDPVVQPASVLYDVELTLTLPAQMSGVSGLNAIAHAVEALYASDADPIILLMAEEGIRALAGSLPLIAKDAQNGEARSDALYGAWLCATCLGRTTVALHHKLCHVLGGTFDLPHAETHAAVLPHAWAYNAPAVPEAAAKLRRALATDRPAQSLFDMTASFGAPTALRDLGMPKDGIDRAVELIFKNPYANPRPLEPDAIRALLEDVWAGRRPNA
ncbi:maleylacetate reductase (plasmid) [Tardibacter chloracetimidivorans]|uniref:Maleylacetate reductase n=2 Tax=Sphingomonadaceae TaxID=41297 RepID=A0A1L4A060_9SPHN|nr:MULTISPECIES: maleylacetate reductase [Sphingomonadaceae]API61263.1 maleylacetate reductase [Tardibacter chloracetimidivorans]MBB4151234.1 alcohol dehydrogenase class IV [Sphingobium scionense]